MGIWGSHLYSVQPEKLEELIQISLRPYGGCQKQIEDTVNAICAFLEETRQLPQVICVAKVSGRLGSGLLGARRCRGHRKEERRGAEHLLGDRPWVRLASPCPLRPRVGDGYGVEPRGTALRSSSAFTPVRPAAGCLTSLFQSLNL